MSCSSDVEVNIVLDAAVVTKTVEGFVDEDVISDWYVLIYNSAGLLLKEIHDISGTSCSFVVDANRFAEVTLYAFANYDRSSLVYGYATESDLLRNSYGLEDVGTNLTIPMCRKLQVSFSNSRTLVICLERMVAKIRLHSLNVDLKGEFADDSFSQGACYLLNVVGRMTLGQYFSRTAQGVSGLWFYHANWLYTDFSSSSYQGSHDESDDMALTGGMGTVFYALPNYNAAHPSSDPDWADLCTKIVLESSYYYGYLGIDLEVYYPVELLDPGTGCLEANNVYDVDMTVCCPGYLNPWGPRDNSDPDVSFTLSVNPWNARTIEETI